MTTIKQLLCVSLLIGANASTFSIDRAMLKVKRAEAGLLKDLHGYLSDGKKVSYIRTVNNFKRAILGTGKPTVRLHVLFQDEQAAAFLTQHADAFGISEALVHLELQKLHFTSDKKQ